MITSVQNGQELNQGLHTHVVNGRIPIFVCNETMDERGLENLRMFGVDGFIRRPVEKNLVRLQEMFKGLFDLDQRQKVMCDSFRYDRKHWEAGGWLTLPRRDGGHGLEAL